MSRRRFPVGLVKVPGNGKPPSAETRPLSDASKLIWAQFMGPMEAAAQQLNLAMAAARNTVATQLMKAEGLDPEDWQFNMDTLRFVRRQEGAGAVDQ